LGGDEFLFTDGSKGLHRLRWSGGPMWKKITASDPEAPLHDRIVSPPLVLPPGAGQNELLVCVADSRGTLTLLHEQEATGADKPRKWAVVRSWSLKGHITAGPFLRGTRIGCVLDQERLVWIDPASDTHLWEYGKPGEGIVGQPQVIGDQVVVALRTGRFVGLDPATGRPRGPGYALKGSVAPATTPVAFGTERAFAPLTDGTVLLLSLKHLRQ
jgi:hypothetical protein